MRFLRLGSMLGLQQALFTSAAVTPAHSHQHTHTSTLTPAHSHQPAPPRGCGVSVCAMSMCGGGGGGGSVPMQCGGGGGGPTSPGAQEAPADSGSSAPCRGRGGHQGLRGCMATMVAAATCPMLPCPGGLPGGLPDPVVEGPPTVAPNSPICSWQRQRCCAAPPPPPPPAPPAGRRCCLPRLQRRSGRAGLPRRPTSLTYTSSPRPSKMNTLNTPTLSVGPWRLLCMRQGKGKSSTSAAAAASAERARKVFVCLSVCQGAIAVLV